MPAGEATTILNKYYPGVWGGFAVSGLGGELTTSNPSVSRYLLLMQ